MAAISLDHRYPDEAKIINDIKHVIGHLRRIQQRMKTFHTEDNVPSVMDAINLLDDAHQSILRSIEDYPHG